MSRPYGPDPYRRGPAFSRGFLPLALITLGVVVLLSNYASSVISERGRGGLIVLGLGAAFAVGRLTTGRYGYAVPAGLLVALGVHIIAGSLDITRGASSAGLFFVLFGLGFVLIYVIGLRPSSIWPLFPGAILVGLGMLLLGVASLGPLGSWSWIASFWPAALVLVGAWLLFRESLPPAARGPIASLGGMALLIYGVLAAATSIAAAGDFARSGVGAASASPFADTFTLPATPLGAGQTFTVNNTSGSTTIHATDEPTVHVVATRHHPMGGRPPDIRLTPDDTGLSLKGSGVGGVSFPFGDNGSVDYDIALPASAAVHVQSTSGRVTVRGITGAVTANSTSGGLDISNVGGEVQAKTTSGSISIDSVLIHAASVSTSSGSVNIRLQPGSAVMLDAHSNSGTIEPRGLMLDGGVTQAKTLTGAVGAPAEDATLQVRTSSGSITISQ